MTEDRRPLRRQDAVLRERRRVLEVGLVTATAECGDEASLGRGLLPTGSLPLDPVVEIRVGQFPKRRAVQTVVVEEDREAVLAAVPYLPDERPVPEQSSMLGEEVVTQPRLQRGIRRACLSEQTIKQRWRPGRSMGASE